MIAAALEGETGPMAQDMTGLQAELSAMKQELLSAVAGVAGSVAELQAEFRSEIASLDKKIQYLCDHLLGDADKKELRRAVGGR
jgi:hypothetical protein